MMYSFIEAVHYSMSMLMILLTKSIKALRYRKEQLQLAATTYTKPGDWYVPRQLRRSLP